MTMPMYEYQAEDGQVVEEFMPMNIDHPEVIERGGKTFRRVFGNHRVNGKGGQSNEYPYASLRLKGFPAANDCQTRDVVLAGVPHKDVPIVRSKKHEAELCAKHGLTRE